MHAVLLPGRVKLPEVLAASKDIANKSANLEILSTTFINISLY